VSTIASEYKGAPIVVGRISFPVSGIWVADVRFDRKLTLPDRITLSILGMILTGTIYRAGSGDYMEASSVKVFGGAGGWKTKCPPNHFRGGGLPGFVRTQTMLDDLARISGETIVVDPGVLRDDVGYPDYVRAGAPAFRVLNNLIDATTVKTPAPTWWVQDDGTTRLGYRPVMDAPKGTYTVLDYDPSVGLAEVACETPALVRNGARIRTPDGQVLTIRESQVNLAPNKSRLMVWT
jgi:hypothetical protein